MSSVALLALAPQNGSSSFTSSVTAHCETGRTHTWESISEIIHCLPTCRLQKQEQTGLLIGGDGEGAGAGSAGVASVQAGSQHVAVFTHFTEIPCTVVPAVLKGRILKQSMGCTVGMEIKLTEVICSL